MTDIIVDHCQRCGSSWQAKYLKKTIEYDRVCPVCLPEDYEEECFVAQIASART